MSILLRRSIQLFGLMPFYLISVHKVFVDAEVVCPWVDVHTGVILPI